MERRCEPELMEDAAQAQAYAEADFSRTDRQVIAAIVDLLGHEAAGSGEGLRFVDLGCGPGNIALLLAGRWPGAEVLGLDGSSAMLAIAEKRRLAAPLTLARLRFRQVVLPCGSLPAGAFTVVVSNSLLHHLHDPQVLWAGLRQLAAPAAWIYIKDLRRPASREALEALVARHAAGAPPVLRHDFAHSLEAAFSAGEVAEQLRTAGLDGLRLRELDDRYLEVAGRLG
ncbi:trans-aconitate 2-methyltransferase [Synechococcus sp. CCY 9618]|uniref:class I SAM-dependent methyltransferase n=1 Tax=Synechococcus sp. CCY 9618 TaxID=2815602 RepID=UPI001C2232D5|nr:class I SAM-dependent methyltransferase [Synechococcus sp. CCY 9618]